MRSPSLQIAAVGLVGLLVLAGCDAAVCEPAPETCDGADDDCDGLVDETFPLGRPCSVGLGACAADGVIGCTEDGLGAACDARLGQPESERCDGVDNDCDGSVDDDGDLAAAGLTGGSCESEALCGAGVLRCQGGAVVCGGARRGAVEACDGVDNDCDGGIDEETDLRAAGVVGALCGDPKGTCPGATIGCVQGELVCVRVRPSSVERCDGLDNDCDGDTDDPADLILAGVIGGSCGSAEGACALGVRGCDRGGLTCEGEVAAGPEVCDGVDNDCDGALDEGRQGDSAECGVARGRCEQGVLVCVAGEPVCAGGRDPVDEVCNGLDDDCDGVVDGPEALAAAGAMGVACGQEQGRCVPGTTVCLDGAVQCAGGVSPREERCDGADDDCDGVVDEGTLNACGGCGLVPDEVCDGVDDDCDGVTDEGFVGLGDRCSRDGDCRVGAQVCTADQAGVCCSADPDCDPARVLGDELCDGADNDCDGAIDEGWALGQACVAPGRCGAGELECLDVHRAGCDVGLGGSAYGGGPEVCDGQDNDCDDGLDEGVANACGGCGPAPDELCDGDDDDCDGAVDEGSTNACGGCGAAPEELCNGVDDDCDGGQDEGFLYLDAGPGALCDGVGRCAIGRVECAADGRAVRCSTDPGGADSQARIERCDGLDDDCDGAVDEGFEGLGAACDGEDRDLCPGGVVTCAPDTQRVTCSGDDDGGVDDLCDGADDDCDGAVDEATLALTSACQGGRAHSSATCVAGDCALVCAPGFADDDGDLADEQGNGCEAYSGPRFTDVTDAAGVGFVHFDRLSPGVCSLRDSHCVEEFMSGGAAAGDYDGDGWIDLYVTRLDDRDILFRNRGDGTFEDATLRAGLTDDLQSNGAVLCDLDNDDDLDLYVTTIGEDRFRLYINDGAGGFDEDAVSRGAHVPSDQPRVGFSVACGDFDRDGWADLHTTENRVAGMEAPNARSHARLLRNRGADGPGTFEDVTEAAGVSLDGLAEFAVYAYASVFSDLDDDGWPDLLVSSDRRTSRLFWNDGAGGFLDGTQAAGVGTDDSGMGAAVGDYDGDGRLDWFVSAIYEFGFCDLPPCPLLYSGNRMYRNEGGRRFSDQTDATGVRNGYWGWGSSFLDYDNDGDLDLVHTNGGKNDPWVEDPMRLWRNDDGVMQEVSDPAGLTDRGDGKGLLVFDYDDDGDLDVFVMRNEDTPRLYRNDGVGDPDAAVGGWLRVKLRGTSSTRDGLGARITLHPTGDGPAQLREIRGGSNYLGQNEMIAHFGLGEAAVDRVVVRWPVSGVEQVIESPQRNSTVVITEP